jgi:hypothetical protein
MLLLSLNGMARLIEPLLTVWHVDISGRVVPALWLYLASWQGDVCLFPASVPLGCVRSRRMKTNLQT